MGIDNYTKLTKDDFYRECFSRHKGILTEEETEKLKNSTVAVAGAGGGGGISAERLVRLGIGHIKLADPEEFEESNSNRQFGCNVNAIGKKKAEVVGSELKKINPYLQLDLFTEGINESNIDNFLDGADILVEEVEGYYFKLRAMLHAAARNKGLYSMRCDTVGLCSPIYVFAPDGMTFEEFFDLPKLEEIPSDMEEMTSYLTKHFAGGFAEKFFFDKLPPSGLSDEVKLQILKKEIPFPTVSFGCSLIGTLVANEVFRILLNKGELLVVPKCMNLDLFEREIIIKDFSK